MGAGASSSVPSESRHGFHVALAAAKFGMARAKLTSGDAGLMSPIAAVAMICNIEASLEKQRLKNQHSLPLYEDSAFPCTSASLLGSSPPDSPIVDSLTKMLPNITWKRPSEFVMSKKKPCLFEMGAYVEDVVGGLISNCALIPGLAVLAATLPEQIESLFVHGTSMSPAGIYGVRFFIQGRWQTAVIDDRLPCTDAGLVFGRSSQKNELWVSLVEKAYAKLMGGYANMLGRQADVVWPELTGGFAEVTPVQHKDARSKGADKEVDPKSDKVEQTKLWTRMRAHVVGGAFLACSASLSSREAEKRQGIHSQQAYAILEATQVDEHCLIRLSNPNAQFEWNGAWSDTSELWTDHMRMRVGVEKTINRMDGTFWMCLADFVTVFDTLYVIKSNHAIMPAARVKTQWDPQARTAGGAASITDQPHIVLKLSGDNATVKGTKSFACKKMDGRIPGGVRTVIILTQELDYKKGGAEKKTPVAIGFDVVRIKEKVRTGPVLYDHITADNVEHILHWSKACQYLPCVEVHHECELIPNETYFIIPKTEQAGVQRNFLLRVYSECAVTVRDLGRTLSTESRLTCIHCHLNSASVAGGWGQEAAYACHPACERSDPPPERSFAAAPRYKLKVGGGAKKAWVWIRLSTFQEVQKMEVVDRMEEQQARAELLFQGKDRGVVVLSEKEIMVAGVHGANVVQLQSSVTAEIESTVYVSVEGEDESRVRRVAAEIRAAAPAHLSGEEVCKYVTRPGRIDTTGMKKDIMFRGASMGACIKGSTLYLNAGSNTGLVTMSSTGIKLVVDTEISTIRIKGSVRDLEKDVKQLVKIGLWYEQWDNAVENKAVLLKQAIDLKSGRNSKHQLTPLALPDLEDVLVAHRKEGVVALMPPPPAPFCGLFVESIPKAKHGKTKYHTGDLIQDSWCDADNGCQPENDELWTKVLLSEGTYHLVTFSGGPGLGNDRQPRDTGTFVITCFSTSVVRLENQPIIDKSSVTHDGTVSKPSKKSRCSSEHSRS